MWKPSINRTTWIDAWYLGLSVDWDKGLRIEFAIHLGPLRFGLEFKSPDLIE